MLLKIPYDWISTINFDQNSPLKAELSGAYLIGECCKLNGNILDLIEI